MTVFTVSIVVVLVSLYFWYAGIIRKRNGVLEALADIDVQLKKRADLIPNILKIAQKYMQYEKSVMTDITGLRTRALKDYDPHDKEAVKEHLAATDALFGKMGGLLVSVENYPTLKADATMVQAQQSYNETESQIAAARRFYNSAAKLLNNAVQIFPGNVIAKSAGVSTMPFYETDAASKAPVAADDILK